MNKYKAIFFDLDETIYSEFDYRMGAFRNTALWLQKNENIDFESVMKSIIDIIDSKGSLYRNIFQDIVNLYNLDSKMINQLIDVFRSYTPVIQPYPDFCEFIKKASDSYHLGIITEGIGYVQRKKIEALKLKSWIEDKAIIISDEFNPPTKKDNISLFIFASSIFNLPGKECIYIGDNPEKDFEQPYKLGWFTVRIHRGVYKEERGNNFINYDIDLYNNLSELLCL
ncbi:MAG: hypothetical protein APR63_11965 [Desulfuromonas sp. SDB]|nr:MAG: hypothetical protein APR63_11965 [Desulfuromonas sp. SDB]